jgi:hypothetical protein
MDLAESSILERPSLKREARRFLIKSVRPSSLRALERLLVQLLATGNLNSKSAETNHHAVGVLTVKRKLGAFNEDNILYRMQIDRTKE